MTPVLERDARELRRALSTDADHVSVSLSRQTAELLARVVDAQARGHEIVFSRVPDEVSPAEAARILRMSRPHVRALMERGDLPYRMVGSHHRIPVADLHRYQDVERARRRGASADFLALENELGLTE